MPQEAKSKKGKTGIYEKYRCILERPDLSDKEIDEMRKNLGFLSQIICEHVWKKKFY